MKKIITAVFLGCLSSGACAAEFDALAVKASDVNALAAAQGITVQAAPALKASSRPVEWVVIGGGQFTRGTNSGETGFEDAVPARLVSVQTFEMSRTAVTVEQYAECVSAGVCTEPGAADQGCNWGKPGRQQHPVNCVYLSQANQYAGFKGARLPSESEWEYAATSGGRNIKYPWGNSEPTCDKAVMAGNAGYGCGVNGTMPVCSRPAGNTAQGLCDMAGNVWQWTQDTYRNSYSYSPLDGSAYRGTDFRQVKRGGSFFNDEARDFRAGHRGNMDSGSRNSSVGFRLARSVR